MSRIAKDLSSSRSVYPEASRQLATTSAEMPRVAVIGAGVSGLRCAALLAQSRFKVTVYEARNRVGGRVHQDLNDGHMVDMGSNWIHGTEGNPMSRLAQRTGTVVWTPEERSLVVDENGVTRSEQESEDLSEEFWAQVVQAFKYADQDSANIPSSRSLKDYLGQAWEQKYPKQPQRVKDLLNESAVWGQFVGGRVETQSLKFFWLEECLEGENVFVASTYHNILKYIADPVVHNTTGNVKLKLNSEVTRVQYGDTCQHQKVTVMVGDSQPETFDEVVVTCPLGWLKHNKERVFEPALPARLSQAIDNIGYGALEKIYISFSAPWWLNKSSGAGTPADSLPSSPGSTSQDQSSNSSASSWTSIGATYPPITSFHSPRYHTIPESKDSLSFNQSVISLAHLPRSTNHATLLFYITGDASRYLTTALSKHGPDSPESTAILSTLADPFISRLPKYNPDDPICHPTSYLATSWSLDPYAGFGSYSNFPVGLEAADEDIECMRASGGLGTAGEGLWLAGEHTAPFVALGTTTGAYWSGEGVARQICRQHGVEMVEDEFSSSGGGKDVENGSRKGNRESERKAEDGKLGKALHA